MNRWLPKNEHWLERLVRVALGAALIWLAAAAQIGVWGYLGVIPLATGLLGSCPVYTLLGISTCPLDRSQRELKQPGR